MAYDNQSRDDDAIRAPAEMWPFEDDETDVWVPVDRPGKPVYEPGASPPHRPPEISVDLANYEARVEREGREREERVGDDDLRAAIALE